MKVKEIVDRERALRLSLQLEEHPFDREKKFKEYDDFMSRDVIFTKENLQEVELK